jgi:hypothetical protein
MNMHAQAIEATTEADADDADLLTVTTFTDLQAKTQEFKRSSVAGRCVDDCAHARAASEVDPNKKERAR